MLSESDITREARISSFSHWKGTIDARKMIEAGFFCCNVGDRVICIYCDKICQGWKEDSVPRIVHAKLCESCPFLAMEHKPCDTLIQPPTRPPVASNDAELSRLISARLDLPGVSKLRDEYKLSIVKRCLEDYLRLKNDDPSMMELRFACMILAKQIEVIKGNKNNIVMVSSMEM